MATLTFKSPTGFATGQASSDGSKSLCNRIDFFYSMLHDKVMLEESAPAPDLPEALPRSSRKIRKRSKAFDVQSSAYTATPESKSLLLSQSLREAEANSGPRTNISLPVFGFDAE